MEKNYICTICLWEGIEEELSTNTDLSDNNIGHEIGFNKCCPECYSEEIEEI